MTRPPLLSLIAGAALLVAGFCAGRGSRASSDGATKAWLDSAQVRDSTFAALRDSAVRAATRGDSLAAIARRPVVVVRTVLQPQLDTATTTRDSLLILVAQRDSLLESVHRWALAFAAVSAARGAETARADAAERELLRATALLRKARGARCGIFGGAGILASGAGVRSGLVLGVGCRVID